jgi:hypothetical protein
MWIEKLTDGVLRVLTPLGPRYIKPSFFQRVYLLWIFRHFDSLPPQVLSVRTQRLLDALCNEYRFVSFPQPNGLVDAPVIGTLEKRPAVAEETLAAGPSTAVAGTVTRLVNGLQERS